MSTVHSPASVSFDVDDSGAALVEQARERAGARLVGAREVVAVGLGVAFLAAAVSAEVLLPAVRPFSPAALGIGVVIYAVVSQVEFEVGHGVVHPSQLVLVPMLFALPPRTVPLAVAAGYLLGHLPALARRRLALSHIPLMLANATHALGPAVVLSLAARGRPEWSGAPVYVGALAAQFGGEFVVSAIWARVAYGLPIAEHAKAMRTPVIVDTVLAPVGLAAAFATPGRPWGMLLVLPLVALLKTFARERQVRIDHALELSTAYRGTAMLLGDVIEADDEYTGTHSRDVVELVLAVADQLGLDPRERRQAEFAALLHDIGKVKIPAEVINKPGPLNTAELALMRQHTIFGESMLLKIGGLLGDVGHVVRSCHERWDGAGYPDRLAGESIPLAARIVCACDAWSAMTTDRSYRKAMPQQQAAAELRACSGTHFDPRVVDALLVVLGLDD